MSPKLDLEFIPSHDFSISKLNILSFSILLIGLFISAYVYTDYNSKQKEYLDLNLQLQHAQPSQNLASVKVINKTLPDDEIKQLQDTIEELSKPWGSLLSGLEQIKVKDIALLSMVPSSKKHQLVLNGEAKNMQSALVYIMALEELPMLSQVYLKKHTIDQTNPNEPVAFTIIARWQ